MCVIFVDSEEETVTTGDHILDCSVFTQSQPPELNFKVPLPPNSKLNTLSTFFCVGLFRTQNLFSCKTMFILCVCEVVFFQGEKIPYLYCDYSAMWEANYEIISLPHCNSQLCIFSLQWFVVLFNKCPQNTFLRNPVSFSFGTSLKFLQI